MFLCHSKHSVRRFDIRPIVGAYIPTGGQRDQLINALMTGGQAQWSLSPRWALVGTYAWSPSADKSTLNPGNPLYTGDEQRLDVRQYDVGVQARLGDLSGSPASDRWSMHPFVGAGLGSRQYKYRHPAIAATLVGKSGATDMMGYGALGTDVVRRATRAWASASNCATTCRSSRGCTINSPPRRRETT